MHERPAKDHHGRVPFWRTLLLFYAVGAVVGVIALRLAFAHP